MIGLFIGDLEKIDYSATNSVTFRPSRSQSIITKTNKCNHLHFWTCKSSQIEKAEEQIGQRAFHVGEESYIHGFQLMNDHTIIRILLLESKVKSTRMSPNLS